jgi:hypothetical protein
MNHIFIRQLRKYILVFFDDILIYNKTWDEHLAHLGEVLGIMQAQSLYAKESKCEFGMRELLYLGISSVSMEYRFIRTVIQGDLS